MQSLESDTALLEQHVLELEQKRFESPFDNDIFEAVADWRQLGNMLMNENPKADFPGRAGQELELLHQLRAILSRRSLEDQARCAPLFEAAERIIKVAEVRPPSKDGYLGFLKVTRQKFGFLQSEHGFKVVDEEPMMIRFSSGKIYVELDCGGLLETTCVFGLEPRSNQHFWLSDLLFLYGDQRYLDFRGGMKLVETEAGVESWFTFAATIFKQFGKDIVANAPGVFERLQEAQDRRDREYTGEMDRLYPPKA